MDRDFVGTAPSYDYSAVQAGQIRILQLAPGKKGDPFVGELITTQLDQKSIEYDALSYMWGDPAPTDVIWISEKALPIANNLQNALAHLRHEDSPLIIWIDAICIDQNNEPERAQQVQLMGRLYGSAQMVRIWIYEPDIDQKSEAVVSLQTFPREKIDPNTDDTSLLLQRSGHDPEFWNPVLPLFRNAYWSRAWYDESPPKHHFLCTGPVDEITSMNSRGRLCLDLYHLLGTSSVECSRPQDHIYAIMHLASDYEEGGILVDYSKNGYEVAVDAAAYHVRKHSNVRFLEGAYLELPGGLSGRSERFPDETTWVPRSWYGHGEPGWSFTSFYEAAITWCAPDAVLADERILRLRGFKVDRADINLTSGFDTNCYTANHLWTSPLGQYLRDFAKVGSPKLPVETFKVLESNKHLELILYEATISALAVLLSLVDDPKHIYEKLIEELTPNRSLFQDVDKLIWIALTHIFRCLYSSMIIMTESKRLAWTPKCIVQKGDEVWVVLGCNVPVVLRPLPNGRYWHICGAGIPMIQEHELLQNLSSDIAPGDRVGEWVVEDIELV
ncbi:heterokaryon incompatibility protein-domain-containing protein [Phaeosphaeria sp. MPI-PUGE-AT-0046c]|nr:heterokaryon incompatibility protein-domain-containing protein [Phaeosphaeria sp. MPI-PUGE-AT-0046c]